MLIEQRISQLSPTKQALLREKLKSFASTSPRTEAELVAFVVAQNDVDVDGLRKRLDKSLPNYMVPARVLRLTSLPLTPNGKIDRRALAHFARQSLTESTDVTTIPALDEIESQLKAIWSELLEHDRFTIYDSFFEVGGHSLLAIRLLARVNDAFNCSLPISLIVEAPTIDRLAGYLRAASKRDAPPSIVAIQPEGSLPPLYFFPLHMHGPLHYRHLVNQLGNTRPLFGFDGFDIRGTEDDGVSVETLAKGYLEQLLKQQPQGPYYLCGISIAGLLAYEVGRLLHARGEREVEIILFDTYGPGYPQRVSLSDRVRQYLMLRHDSAVTRSQSVALTDAVDLLFVGVQRLSSAWKLWQARTQRRQMDLHASESVAVLEPDYAALSMDFINLRLGQMTRTYLSQLRPYAGSIHLIRARMKPLDHRYDETLGWRNFVSGRIHVHHARGDHLGILRRHYVRTVSHTIHAILGECDVAYGNSLAKNR